MRDVVSEKGGCTDKGKKVGEGEEEQKKIIQYNYKNKM